jgi:hypothetical protein
MGFGVDILNSLDFNPTVLNIAVPESLRQHEDQIRELYMSEFHFSKVAIANIYNDELGLELDTTNEDDLSVNIIFVPNGQNWFVFDYRVSPENGNQVTDPIVWIDTNNVSPNRLMNFINNGMFFYSDSTEPFAELQDAIARHGLEDTVFGIRSLHESYQIHVQQLWWGSIRRVCLITILALATMQIHKSRTKTAVATQIAAIPYTLAV